MFKKRMIIISIFLILFLSVGMVSASDELNQDPIADNDINIEIDDVDTKINDEIHSEISDGSENVSIETDACDAEFSMDNTTYPNISKVPVTIKPGNLKTYVNSDIFFKVKLIDTVTHNPLKDINVMFRVYSDKTHYKDYFATTDGKGVASLNKNLKVGTYTVYTYVKDSSVIAEKLKSTYKVKATAEMGCCSFYVQVSSTEGVAGFRRDSTYAADLYIKNEKWHGRTAIKQYKTAGTYFFHSITTSDGWMMGTGGVDNPDINRAIENLAGQMVESGKIQKSILRKIRAYEQSLGIGHFAIKAPNGKYAVIWSGGVKTGKLKAGEYISVPNSPYNFRQGTYDKFNSNPAKAALRIGATDAFGVNRRDITIFHWKQTTDSNFQTTSKVKVYAANDDGSLMGRYTPHLKDNIHFKGKYISKDSLPKVPKMKKLGTHKFGNIDSVIKTPTKVKAPRVTAKVNATKYFKISVKNKNTRERLGGVKMTVKVSSDNFTKSYIIKTDSNGIAKLNTRKLSVGSYDVVIAPANNKYIISGVSAIEIV